MLAGFTSVEVTVLCCAAYLGTTAAGWSGLPVPACVMIGLGAVGGFVLFLRG